MFFKKKKGGFGEMAHLVKHWLYRCEDRQPPHKNMWATCVCDPSAGVTGVGERTETGGSHWQGSLAQLKSARINEKLSQKQKVESI